MGFGNACGYKKLLVLSGGTNKEELDALPKHSELQPDFYANSLHDFYMALKKLC